MLSGRTEVAKPHPSCLPSSPRGHPRLNSRGSGYVPSGTFGKDDELRRAEKNARSSNLPVPSASVIPSPPERTASEEIAAVKRQVYRSSAQCDPELERLLHDVLDACAEKQNAKDAQPRSSSARVAHSTTLGGHTMCSSIEEPHVPSIVHDECTADNDRARVGRDDVGGAGDAKRSSNEPQGRPVPFWIKIDESAAGSDADHPRWGTGAQFGRFEKGESSAEEEAALPLLEDIHAKLHPAKLTDETRKQLLDLAQSERDFKFTYGDGKSADHMAWFWDQWVGVPVMANRIKRNSIQEGMQGELSGSETYVDASAQPTDGPEQSVWDPRRSPGSSQTQPMAEASMLEHSALERTDSAAEGRTRSGGVVVAQP